MMALTKSFKELMQKRVASDPAFGEALLREAIDALLAGDLDTGKAVLRDYIKATVGFERLGEATGAPTKSLIAGSGRRTIFDPVPNKMVILRGRGGPNQKEND